MTPRTERAICVAVIVATWLFFFVQALHTPTLLDDWYQLTWHRHHPLNLSSIWEYGYYNYFNFNPRVGDILMMLVNGPSWIHLVFTPLVQMAVLPLAFVTTFGRWPRLAIKDIGLMLMMQVLIWLVCPIPGIVYFYRPFTTNYVWAFAIMMLLFAPYRLELARAAGSLPRRWLVPLMLPLGWVAGMGNEHTGPTAMVAMAGFLYVAWRNHRLRAWMISGAIGLYIGYPMLFLAPGQKLRYAGIATRDTPVYLIKTRGPDGLFEVLLSFFAESEIVIVIVVVALLLAYRKGRDSFAGFTNKQLLAFVALISSAGGMVVTMFASPTVGERLFFAPAVLFVGALAVLIDWVWKDTAAKRWLAVTLAVLGIYQATRMVQVLAEGYEENAARLAQLRAAPPDTVVVVKPFKLWKRSRYWWGDDFQYASLREYVANEVFDLKGIEYDRPLYWVEPSPHDKFIARRTFDPPMSPEDEAKITPRYIPTFWEWAITQLRRSVKLGPIKFVKGHTLVHYEVDSESSQFDDPKHRPIRVFEWTPHEMTFVDGRMFDDPNGEPYVRVWEPTMPPNIVDVYVASCGTTKRVELVPDRFEHVGPLIPIDLRCHDSYSAFVCQPDLCWHAGRYWR